jgi:hypothetical protein
MILSSKEKYPLSTSAYGPMQKASVLGAVIVLASGLGLSSAVTTTTFNNPVADLTGSRLPGQIVAPSRRNYLSTSGAVMEIRRLAGLTWGELAVIFSVSPKTIHNWVNGNIVSAKNELHIRRVLSTVRLVFKGQSDLTRSALLDSGEDGRLPFDLLKEGEFEEVERRLGITGSSLNLTRVSDSVLAARGPTNQMSLLEAEPDIRIADKRSKAGFVRPPSKKV